MTPTKPILPLNARIAVIGSGGREAALARRLHQDSPDRCVFVLPGREGCIPDSEPDIKPEDFEADLFVIGPEAPLVDGLADRLRAQGKTVLGPGADGAKLEGSKIWMKDLLWDASVPTAGYESFAPDQVREAEAYLANTPGPWAIKTDYLMGGKGVLVTGNFDEALADARAKLSKGSIVIEEALQGREFSVFAIADGTTAVCIGSAQDYKYLIKDGVSHMTGGVGSYSPVDWVTDELMARVMDECILPTLAELRKRGIDYRGFLYWGGMLTDDGAIMTLEFNIRLGDPEAQVVLPRIIGDFGQMLYEVAHGQLTSHVLLDDRAAVCVVACGRDYPAASQFDALISWQTGINYDDAHAYRLYAGTREAPHAMIVTDGGRVLNFVGLGARVSTARRRAYKLARTVEWDGMVLPDYIAAEAD